MTTPDGAKEGRAEVLAWPGAQHRFAEYWMEDGLVIFAIQTPLTTIRHMARALVRKALREALGILLEREQDDVPLLSAPGTATRLDLPGSPISLSISHEPGLSLAAICRHGAVGLDLMRIDASIEWESVAKDYLGPEACNRIASVPLARQAEAFAREWTRLEASLKCHGMALTEWHRDIEALARQLTVTELNVPPGFAGAVAYFPAVQKTCNRDGVQGV